MVLLLVAHNCDVNIRNAEGKSASELDDVPSDILALL
jgi:hypothetical protein